jgi:predicted CoA-binding protein
MIPNVEDFLSCRRIAVVGVSHDPKDFSRTMYRAFRDRGYEVVPVNPNVRQVDGERCFPRLRDVEPKVDAALLMTSPAVSEYVMKDCVAQGVERVWLYRRAPAAESLGVTAGLRMIAGECPLMFLPNVGFIHRVHRWFRRP